MKCVETREIAEGSNSDEYLKEKSVDLGRTLK